MAHLMKNSLYVRNLSPHVSEMTLREYFGDCDAIEKVLFKPYPNNSAQFFAQIDFKTSKGPVEGSKLSGTNIMGVECACGVIDPTELLAKQPQAKEGDDFVATDDVMAEELKRRQMEEEEDVRFRTIHVAGLSDDITEEKLKGLMNNFGVVADLRLVRQEEQAPFGLVEFAERGPAHVAKVRKHFTVDGKLIEITEAKTFVNESTLQERNVFVQNPLLDAMNMSTTIAEKDDLKDKLAKVRSAANKLFKEGEEQSSSSSSLDEEAKKALEEKQRLKQEKKERRAKKIENKLRREDKRKRRADKEQKKKADAERAAAEEKEAKDAKGRVDVSDETSGTIQLDDEELEVVHNSELLVLRTSSSASSSSSEEKKADDKANKGPPVDLDTNGKKKEDAKPGEFDEVGKEGVWDIDDMVNRNTMDVEAEARAREERIRKRREKLAEKRKVVVTTSASNVCPVPNCTRPGGHVGPHIDATGATLVLKVTGNVSDDYRQRLADAGVAIPRKKSRSRSRRRRRRRD
eukprot:TRINITY_DN75186_c0_g1_i1.p1 TRINITY_DN75186_c0_g1~~TRINITY_DN75186_c0_g1_i1.p1  ORF type:complete len:518 (-),score=167.71 TRINITY_DN75186_c0_g1_i1:78-1631(-)